MNAASVRGLAVLAVAVLLGFLLLSRSEELAPSVEARSDRTTPTTKAKPPATQLAPATTTTPAGSAQVRPPDQVNVIVLNGSGGLAKGVAGDTTAKLADLGYKTVDPGNAPARDASVVYFADGFQGEAAAVQQALGLPGTVEPLKELPTAEARGANLVIVLGGDAASLVVNDEPPESTTTTTAPGEVTTTTPSTTTPPATNPSTTTSTTVG